MGKSGSKSKISVLGAGGWGLALAKVLCENGHEVSVWSKVKSELDELKSSRTRPSVLEGVYLPEDMGLSYDLKDCSGADFVIMATAAKYVNATAAELRNIIGRDCVIISVAKGLDPSTERTLSSVISEQLPGNRVVVLSGPSHAEEVSRGVPTALVSASSDRKAAEMVADLFINPSIRVYLSSDVTGVELGGVIKNVIALAAGIIDGMGYGDNTKAALMTRAIVEMARLGKKLGGNVQTFAGLTGIGDLIVTCTSMHSRNRRCGILIGQGTSPAEAAEKIGMTVEGIASAKAVHELAQKNSVEMPIVSAVYRVLYEGCSVEKEMGSLMRRSKKTENEDAWF